MTTSIIIYTPEGAAEFKDIAKLNEAKSWVDFVASDGRRIVTTMPYFIQSGTATSAKMITQ